MLDEAKKLTNLEYITKLCCNRPVLQSELERAQPMLPVVAECVDGGAVLDGDVQHVVC